MRPKTSLFATLAATVLSATMARTAPPSGNLQERLVTYGQRSTVDECGLTGRVYTQELANQLIDGTRYEFVGLAYRETSPHSDVLVFLADVDLDGSVSLSYLRDGTNESPPDGVVDHSLTARLSSRAAKRLSRDLHGPARCGAGSSLAESFRPASPGDQELYAAVQNLDLR